MADSKVYLHLGTPEIQIAVLQAQVFRRGDLVFNREWCGFRIIQDPQLTRDNFDLSRFEIWIGKSGIPYVNFPTYSDHVLGSERLCGPMQVHVVLGIEDDLGNTLTVAQIDED